MCRWAGLIGVSPSRKSVFLPYIMWGRIVKNHYGEFRHTAGFRKLVCEFGTRRRILPRLCIESQVAFGVGEYVMRKIDLAEEVEFENKKLLGWDSEVRSRSIIGRSDLL